jgi:hypothetical protein
MAYSKAKLKSSGDKAAILNMKQPIYWQTAHAAAGYFTATISGELLLCTPASPGRMLGGLQATIWRDLPAPR